VPDVTDHHSVVLVLRGAKRLQGCRQRQKPPLSPDHLLQLRAQLRFAEPRNIALWCGILLGWWGLLRKSNVAGIHALRRADVTVLDDGIRVAVRRSKTRQFGGGVCVFLPRIRSKGRVRRLCPWTAVCAHLAVNGVGLRAEQQLLCFATPSGRRIFSAAAFHRLLAEGLRRAGHPVGAFGSHSLRRGGATFAAASGLSLADIQRMGDWRSDVVRRYVGDPSEAANRRAAEVVGRALSQQFC
jgi:integrase